ncbi:hypothetical protein M0R45_030535 [Rubus argutus]|uniref:Uncharacterized protein n=1 Tax=Rubus argutus TaxID=59490 RepID=A0AAW1WDB8_RUBAR
MGCRYAAAEGWIFGGVAALGRDANDGSAEVFDGCTKDRRRARVALVFDGLAAEWKLVAVIVMAGFGFVICRFAL